MLRATGKHAGLVGAVLIVGAALVCLFYLNRIFTPWPLYAGDEGAYLIRALYGDLLDARPERHPTLHPVGNTLYMALIRLVDAMSANLLPWMRLIGLATYIGGLALLHRTLRPSQPGRIAFWGLAAGLAYPFHRFVVTAMPEGLFVLVLAVIAAAAARWALSRPWALAAVLGALCAALVLVKPHGVVIIPAMGVLLMALVVLGQRRIWQAAGQGALFTGAFLITGATIQVMTGRGDAAITFFLGTAYADHFARIPPEPLRTAFVTSLSLGSATLLLTGAPLLAGGRALAGRWRRREAPAPDEVAFLVLAAALLATLAMIVLFAVRISAIPGESGRLWGRYFEFYTPLLWIAAAGPVNALWTDGGRGARLWLAAMPAVGMLGLLIAWGLGVTLTPWDSAALSAFYIPHLTAWNFPAPLPYAGISAAIIGLLCLALLRGAAPLRVWTGALVGLGLVSTHYDHSWVSTGVAAHRAALERDLPVAVAQAPDQSLPVLVAFDHNASHTAFLAYQGKVRVIVRPPGPIPAALLDGVEQVAIMGDQPPPAPWAATFSGEALSLYARPGALPEPPEAAR
ncbi:MAG: hypothetical protein Q8R71_11225 [Phenylobacterium sp.]|nr:hypothetical protein [Phenylobacterium sp.]